MEQAKITKEYDGWIEKCSKCGKEIRGHSPAQLRNRLEIHKRSIDCKSNDIKTKEVKKNESQVQKRIYSQSDGEFLERRGLFRNY